MVLITINVMLSNFYIKKIVSADDEGGNSKIATTYRFCLAGYK